MSGFEVGNILIGPGNMVLGVITELDYAFQAIHIKTPDGIIYKMLLKDLVDMGFKELVIPVGFDLEWE